MESTESRVRNGVGAGVPIKLSASAELDADDLLDDAATAIPAIAATTATSPNPRSKALRFRWTKVRSSLRMVLGSLSKMRAPPLALSVRPPFSMLSWMISLLLKLYGVDIVGDNVGGIVAAVLASDLCEAKEAVVCAATDATLLAPLPRKGASPTL